MCGLQADAVTCSAGFADAVVTLSHINITDFLKGQISGSYKCNAKLTEGIANGVLLETTDLQYQAFNKGNLTAFGDCKFQGCHKFCVCVPACLSMGVC